MYFIDTHTHTHTHTSIAQSELSQSLEEQPSASIKSMWDSVVSWMKTAVDFIAFENPEEATKTDALSPHGKVHNYSPNFITDMSQLSIYLFRLHVHCRNVR